MPGLKAQGTPHVGAGGAEGLCESHAGDIAPMLSQLESTEGDVGMGALCAEVYHPGEDAAHGAGVSVAGASMDYGIPVDCIILVIEGEVHRGARQSLEKGLSDD